MGRPKWVTGDGVLFSELDPFCTTWLGNLYPEAAIDGRNIHRIRPLGLTEFTRCHFFAGIGGWEYALQLAGWPTGRPVWTGSCPCQPFSAAGNRKGIDDSRHLWPEFYRLIAECRPPTIFGEQVASRLGREWLAGVRADLEALGYAVGGADLCAASEGAPHIRQRLFWVAVADGGDSSDRELQRGREHRQQQEDGGSGRRAGSAVGEGKAQWVADSRRGGCHEQCGNAGCQKSARAPGRFQLIDGSGTVRLGHAHDRRSQGRNLGRDCTDERAAREAGMASELAELESNGDNVIAGSGAVGWPRIAPWDNFDVVPCRDGQARRVEPGTFPLAHGVPARVGRLRAYGNAIVPQVAATFVRAFMETGRG